MLEIYIICAQIYYKYIYMINMHVKLTDSTQYRKSREKKLKAFKTKYKYYNLRFFFCYYAYSVFKIYLFCQKNKFMFMFKKISF